jgi:hypothetical protein
MNSKIILCFAPALSGGMSGCSTDSRRVNSLAFVAQSSILCSAAHGFAVRYE